MREIGSEFWTGCTPSIEQGSTMRPESIYSTHDCKVKETISGRTALEYIVEILVYYGKTIAYLPSYCCHTMIEPYLSHGMVVKFYDVVYTPEGLKRIIDEKEEYDVIMLMDYFGHVDEETLTIAQKVQHRGKSVIYDATHVIYSDVDYSPYDFIYGSYRKWLNINCGFFAWKGELNFDAISPNDDNGQYVILRNKLFDLKSAYMNEGSVTKDEFLPLINEAECVLEKDYHHKRPDERSAEVLRTSDANYVKNRRRTNAQILIDAINDIDDYRVRCVNPSLNKSDIPLFVPVLIPPEHRDALRYHLISNDIYCPVHWPLSELHKIMPGSEELFNSELSLICDQRYYENDMLRIFECIQEYLEKIN